MTKAIYKRKYLIGGLFTVSQGESMTFITENVAAGRQPWHWRSSRELRSDPQTGGTTGNGEGF